jgi:hypothetical protein
MKHVEWEDDEYIVCVIVTHWQLSQKNSDEIYVEWEFDEYIVCVIVTLTQKNDETCWMRRWWIYCLCNCCTDSKE